MRPPCNSGEILFCSDRCVTPRTAGQSCDPTINCAATTIQVCAGNLVCAPGGGAFTCQDLGSRQVSRCDRPTDPACPSGTYCLSLDAFNPNLHTTVSVCAGRLAEGQRCTPINGGTATLQCEAGFTCNNGFCRRPCTSDSNCSCETSTSNSACDTAAGFCTRCWSANGRDVNGRPLRCGASAQCCGGLTCETDGTGRCCHALTTSCADGTPCCSGSICHSGTSVCTACGGTDAACASDSDCCNGSAPGGHRCTPAGAPRICCPDGWRRNSITGRCQDFRTDVNNCGGLGNVCPPGANGTPVCVNNLCDYACLPGYDDCDTALANGCETALTTTTNCGRCDTSCPPPANGSAICGYNGALRRCDVSCTQGYQRCGTTTCANLFNDVNNCGFCGRRCAAGATCMSGNCTAGGLRTCHGIPPGQTFTTACGSTSECCWTSSVGLDYLPCVQDQAGRYYCGVLNAGP